MSGTFPGSRPGPGPEHLNQTPWVPGSGASGDRTETGPEEGDLQERSSQHSGMFSYLADIQVLLQVVGAIQLQDFPQRSPCLALPEGRVKTEEGGWWGPTSP